MSRVIRAAPAEHEEQQQAAPAEQQQQAAPAEQQQQAVVAEQQVAVAEQQAAVAEQQAAVAEQQAAVAEQQAAVAEQQVALEQAAPAERWKPPSNTTGVHVHVVVVGLGHGVHRELHVTVPVGAWTCLDLRKVCCQRWDVPLHSTDRTHWRWVGNRGTLEDAKRLEEANAWQRGDNKIYVSRVISAAPAEHEEQQQAAPAEQQQQVAVAEQQAAVAEQQAAVAEQQAAVAEQQAAPAEHQVALEQAAPAERWKPPSNTTGVHVHVVVVGLGHGVHRELHVTVPVGAWTCLDLRKVCCQRWDVPLHSTDRTHWRWVGNRGTLEDAKRLEEANAWQRGDNKIYVSRVIRAAPAEHEEQQQAAPAEQQQQVAVAEQQAAVAEQQAAVAEQQAAVAEQQAAVAEQQVALEQAAPAERWKPPSNTTGVHVHVVVVGLGHGVHRELHVTVPVGAWTCLDLRKVCCQRWDVPLHSTDRTHWRWVGNRGTLEDAKRLEEANAWQRGDNKIYVSRVISAAPAEHEEQQQAAPAEQQQQVAVAEQQAASCRATSGSCRATSGSCRATSCTCRATSYLQSIKWHLSRRHLQNVGSLQATQQEFMSMWWSLALVMECIVNCM